MLKIKNRFILDLSIEKVINLILIGILGLSFYLNYFESIWTKWIPISKAGLVSFGKTGFVKGEVSRRLRNDTLHLPLGENEEVYEDDVIYTGSNSSIEIKLDLKNSIILEPEAILRLRFANGTMLLHLIAGGVSTHFIENRTVKIKYGMKVSEVQIRKGTYFIKNKSAGIQITAFTTKNLLKGGNSEDDNAKAKVSEISDVDSKNEISKDELVTDEFDDGTSASVEDQNDLGKRKTASEVSIPLKLPYPPKGSMLLYQGENKVVIAAKTNCEGPCTLTVFVNEARVFDKNFEDGEFAQFELSTKGLNQHNVVRWAFKDEVTSYEDSFFIAPYSEQKFQESLDQGLMVELL